MTKNPDISFVVPTYQEADNLNHLVKHVYDGLEKSSLTWELIIANDESGDNTKAICEELAKEHPIRLLNRTENRGLALAVIDGAKIAQGEHIVVMDGDMSHPSSLVPQMIETLKDDKIKFVIGSRNVDKASMDKDWSIFRHLATFFATLAAKPLVRIKDPMSGFFCLRTIDWPAVELRPIGYKIGLELIVRGGFKSAEVIELPIHFTDRKIGKSKMSFRELHNYFKHLVNLYRFRWPVMRFLYQGVVGVIGFIVDIIFYYLLQYVGLSHLVSRLISFWPASLSNWWFNRNYTYDDRPNRKFGIQFSELVILTLIGFVINAVTYWSLTTYIDYFEEHKILAFIIGILLGFIFNFLVNNYRVFGKNH